MMKYLGSRVFRETHAAKLGIIFFIITFGWVNYQIWHHADSWNTNPHGRFSVPSTHAIRKLMKDARAHHQQVLSRRSFDVKTAASEYRRLRGRHPPPGYDKWVQAALANDSIIVEEYFDRIYKDLRPYWALEPETLAKRSSAWDFRVAVRNGTAVPHGPTPVNWVEDWAGLVKEFAAHLPDLDMPVNNMDESRIVVPFEKIASYMEQEAKERRMVAASEASSKFQGLKSVDAETIEPYQPAWKDGNHKYWDVAVLGCPTDSPAHGVVAEQNLEAAASFPQDYNPSWKYKGYVSNWTAATDACQQPHLRSLHGTFVWPISLKTTEELIPLFGGCKLSMNNEILIPGAKYLVDEARYSGGGDHGITWKSKKNGLIWRGVSSGGRTTPASWHHLQRHRLVDMLNGTTVKQVEITNQRPLTFEMPPQHVYHSHLRDKGELGNWLTDFTDVGFIGDLCDPNDCAYVHEYFHPVPRVDMKKQYEYKFLPDIDGNSFSARFRSFLQSTSLPLKATIYSEWHDDRLTPWVHFVPLDNTLQDLYAALEFFADGSGAGDTSAQFIANEGKTWAEKVLRREDMRLYVWRLLLEWARICDPNRHTLGYVDDLTSS